ncbi:MAG TPA: acetylxylan esterase [Luteolibacter sp.]|nr:acetylxylan esterase [Luteolibacter sp.]
MKKPACFLIPALMAGIFTPIAFSAPAAPVAPAKVESKATWTVRADHPDAVYKTGETVNFTVKLGENPSVAPDAELFVTLSKDGYKTLKKLSVKLKDGTAGFTGELSEPGFLLAQVSSDPEGKVSTKWGVAVSPTDIKPSMPVPDDFDAFWKGQLAALAKVPLNPDLKPVVNKKAEEAGVEVFDTRVDCVGDAKVSGYYARKIGAKPKSLPAIISLHGAGVRGSEMGGPVTWASRGFIAMDINAHGIDNGKDDAFYKALLEGALKDYRYVGKDSREKSYFTFMFLRAKRALDFLCSQPEWDGKTLIVSGGSQGGFQAFAAAALDDRVTMMVAHVPAGSDHTGMVVDRISGWPKIVPVTDGKPDPAVLAASRYIDNVNFATRCKAKKAVVSVGFVDGVCPPTGCYAAYNAITTKDKKMLHGLGMGHSVDDKLGTEAREAILAHVKR